MNYQENDQLEGGLGSIQQNQKDHPLNSDTLDKNSSQKKDWSNEEPMGDEEEKKIESGILENEEGNGFDDGKQKDGLTDHYDQDEVGDSSYDRDESGTALDEDDERNQTMI